MNDKYEIGKCKGCHKIEPLKNGYCIDCQEKIKDYKDAYKIFGDLFGNPFNL